MAGEQPSKRFGFVNGYDTKSKRRVYEVLKAQGMHMNQQVIVSTHVARTSRHYRFSEKQGNELERTTSNSIGRKIAM